MVGAPVIGTLVVPGTAGAAGLILNDSNMLPDANPGDGACDQDLGTFGDQCSLQAAVDEANALPGADTITATGWLGMTVNAPMTVSSDITINTTTGMLLLYSNNTQDFIVSPGANLTLSNIIMYDGRGVDGGCLVNFGTVSIVGDVRFNGCAASNVGGAIYNDSSATLNVDNRWPTWLGGSLDIQSSSATYGGGIFNNGGAVSLDVAFMSNNSATQGGGAVFNGNNGTMTIGAAGANFDHNSSLSGGALFNTGGSTMNVNYTTLTNNTATAEGGAIINGGADIRRIQGGAGIEGYDVTRRAGMIIQRG